MRIGDGIGAVGGVGEMERNTGLIVDDGEGNRKGNGGNEVWRVDREKKGRR